MNFLEVPIEGFPDEGLPELSGESDSDSESEPDDEGAPTDLIQIDPFTVEQEELCRLSDLDDAEIVAEDDFDFES